MSDRDSVDSWCSIVVNELATVSYTDGNETYTFVPLEPAGARSLTIYRNSGDIVLNRELSKPVTVRDQAFISPWLLAPNTPVPVTSERSGRTIYGILGMITLAMCTLCLYVFVDPEPDNASH